ncbi:hypothetical protein CTEN210_15001 [Chaetoceros tenuissimus]|uniref:Integrase catalytic domain-containing protein n=1 Tax=Chaetoceros tenuissimus TaxID=426638 RepID=A0AAD3D8Q3_9STRA|nr:hypothetical protein CTEN210_15001 [Chaetoceros tenuissimus]
MANNDRKLRSDKKTETAVDTDSSNGAGVTTPPRPTSTGSQLSPLPNGKQVDPFIFDASDATFNSWIKPVCDQELSEEQFHDITADVETMLDTCFHLMKSKSSMTKEDWQKKAKIIEHRLIRIGCAIGYYDAHSVRLFFTRIHEAVDYHDASHAMLYKTKCVHTLAQMILHSHTKSSDTDSTQKKADRISKNKKAFYPDKLSNAADLFLFLQTLELECKRVPHWEAVVTFHDPNKSTVKCTQSFDDKVFHLRWNGNTKTIPISKANNLPILHTAPGVSIACALAEAFHNWDPSLHCLKAQKSVPDYKADLQAREETSDETPEIPTHNMECPDSKCERCSYIKEGSKDILDHKRTLDDNETLYLRWHNQLGHANFEHMKELSRQGLLPRFIKCMTNEPVCIGCKLGKARLRRSKKGSLTTNVTKPGDLIHADQCESSQDGRAFTYSGQNNPTKVNYFTIFVDSVSKKVWVEFQTSTNTEQTLKGKAKVEKNAAKYNVTIKAYRTDNGTFCSKEFMADIEKCDQDITFCGVGAHGQNGMAERYIGIIVANARSMLLNASTHWNGEITTELWTFAVNYAVHTWNHTPRKSLDHRCPEEVFSGAQMTKAETRRSLEQLHTWGCPIYVLEEEIQKGQKPKRWDPLSSLEKTTPAGEIYRHRSRLCVDGSQQKEGIDYTETYSPVISWTTVRVLLILSVLLELKTKAVDYVQAFPQAELDEEDSVYMQIPDGYTPNLPNSVLKLKKNLYGLKQASHNWHNLLKAGLIKLGFRQSDYEPCLFLKDGIICVVYVDDTLFFAKDDKIIDNHISKLKKLGFDLTEEGDVTAFLGVEISKDENGVITMTQTGLIDNILALLGLKDESKQHKTPATSPPLHTDTGGNQREYTWSYRSAIGMLIYLARNTRPDIEYAVHTCARFQLDPKKIHENAVKRIGRYLLGTRDKGIVFKPDINKLGELECFVDADFAGNYTKEQSQDPNSVRSRTGCVILYAGCPIIWFSKLQTEISLSTTEAEYIALSTACRELLPMREMFNELRQFLNILPLTPQVKCTLFEDNVGAETLAKSPKMTPRTKHIAIKYHHFREAVSRGILKIERVDTKEQLADIFTKATTTQTFEYLRRKIMGWLSVFHPIKDKKEEEEFELFCNLSVFGK